MKTLEQIQMECISNTKIQPHKANHNPFLGCELELKLKGNGKDKL